MDVKKKTYVMRISRESFPVQIMIEQQQLENVEYFNHLGSMITNDARYTREIKSKLSGQKQYSTERRLFYQQIGLKLKE